MKTENIAPGKIHNPYWLFYPLLSFPLFMAVLWWTYAILVEYFRDWLRRHNCPISSLVHKTSLLLSLRFIVHSQYFTSQFMCFYARVKFTTGHRMFTFLCSSVSLQMFLMWLILKKSRTGIFMFISRLYSRYWCRRFSSQLLLSQI